RVARINRQQRLHVQVLAPGEELEQTYAVGRAVGPRRWMSSSIDQRANRFLPLIAFADVVAFEVVAAGEAEEFGVERGEFLHQVDALAIRLIPVSGREERDQREPGGSRLLHQEF